MSNEHEGLQETRFAQFVGVCAALSPLIFTVCTQFVAICTFCFLLTDVNKTMQPAARCDHLGQVDRSGPQLFEFGRNLYVLDFHTFDLTGVLYFYCSCHC
jgi:hypothetical protein